ncbi:MAG: hypothetical protein U1F43_06225 [Myxococcota bacterium]
MFVSVSVRLPDGTAMELTPGDLVGRSARVALRIEDPRISEAHALVSLRGDALKLLALRGRLSCGGKALTEVALVPGARVLLGGFYALTVLDVRLPSEVLALELPDETVIVAGVLAFQGAAASPRFSAGFDPQAPAIVWASEAGVHVRRGAGEGGPADAVLRPGDRIELPGVSGLVRLVATRLAERDTTAAPGRFDTPLRIVVHYDAVHVYPAEGQAVSFDGFGARLLSEVAALPTPASWEVHARLLWPDESDALVLRQRWDQTTSRIRKRLRDGRIRADLLRSNRQGLIELFLGPDDRLEDHS